MLQPILEEPPGKYAILSLHYEKSVTPAVIKHGMDIQKQATQYLNPGKIPVTTLDQPLFALAKSVQWKWPETHGEKMHVVMLGGLHTEMALWNTLGDLLDGSGWMLFLAVIRHLHSTDKGRYQCGELGRLMMMLQKHSLAWPSIHLCCWTLARTTFRSWRG